MSMQDIRAAFPSLNRRNCKRKSPDDFSYNCLAFALGDKTNWWEPPGEFGFYWPPGFPGDLSVETVTAIIRLHGFIVELEPKAVPRAEAVAIYAKGEEWLHFAKFTDGVWASKMGEDHDITHASLELLEGDLYGKVVKILSRTK
jgi:hypothetical protein